VRRAGLLPAARVSGRAHHSTPAETSAPDPGLIARIEALEARVAELESKLAEE